MCLIIKKLNSTIEYGYKVYKYYGRARNGKVNIGALHQDYAYTVSIGDVITSNRKFKQLDSWEKQHGRVHEGIHVLQHYEDAIRVARAGARRGFNNKLIIIKVVASKNSLVGVGEWQHDGAACRVYKKIVVKKLVEIFYKGRRKLLV